jgi:hypothetical protein
MEPTVDCSKTVLGGRLFWVAPMGDITEADGL